MIVFNRPPHTGNEDQYVMKALASTRLSGDGFFSDRCHAWFQDTLGCCKALLTPSCTAALEMAAMLIDIRPGDEVIMPSYTFVSTANAFVLRGARIVFVDVHPGSMNINENLIEVAITTKTKAIVPVHYAGASCDMSIIMEIAERYSLYVIEDAAQAISSFFKERHLGSIGHIGTYSFHETKNITSGGEGGLLIINDSKLKERAEIIREKGTNRSKFFRGQVDRYTWVDLGGSYLPSELQAAYLWGQLELIDQIHQDRLDRWKRYDQRFTEMLNRLEIELPAIPRFCQHNAHIYYLKLANLEKRTIFIDRMAKEHGIMCVFHYIPLHSSPAGRTFGEFNGTDNHTTRESERLVRLPMWHPLSLDHIDYIADSAEKILLELR